MSNHYFKFRRFTVYQDCCAMKVGTDGVLLGAWTRCGSRVLDIGTGTGLVALMMAQRCPSVNVVGVEIDHESARQARDNVEASGFQHIEIVEADIRDFYEGVYDTIVCNPPYFVDSLISPDEQRTVARHAVTLTYRELVKAVCRLLADDGEFSVVIPFDSLQRFEQETVLAGLFKVRQCVVRTTPRKQPRRCLVAFRRHPAPLELTEGVIEEQPNVRTAWYQELTKEFYL